MLVALELKRSPPHIRGDHVSAAQPLHQRQDVNHAPRQPMKHTANARFAIKAWDEKPCSEGDDLSTS